MSSFRIESTLPAPIEAVWDRIASVEGINDEFKPWLRMTAPKNAELTLDAVPLNQRWFRSWVLLFGFIPIDYDDLTLVSVDPPHGFQERSKLMTASVWEHRRTLTAVDGGTKLVDELAWTPRPGLGPVLRLIIPVIFRHRHRRLRSGTSRPR